MVEWILSSSVLILAVLLLRLLFRRHISKRLQYFLWALVLLRLLIPVSVMESSVSTGNLVSGLMEQPVMQAASGDLDSSQRYDTALSEVLSEHGFAPEIYTMLPQNRKDAITHSYQEEIQQKLSDYDTAFSAAQALQIVWLAGAAVMGLCLLSANLHFALKLRRSRKICSCVSSLPVYTAAVQTPCLFGLIKPAVYLPACIEDERTVDHILAHEQTHYRHWDHIWAVGRCICLALHWYNPLVWVAVKVSRTDSELACDEGTLAVLGEENRTDYGRTLIEMSRAKPSAGDILLTATTMTGGKKSLYRRIQSIANKPKVLAAAVIALFISTAVAAGCTFTGTETELPAESTAPTEVTQPTESAPSAETKVPPETTVPEETAPTNYPEDEVQGTLARVMGMLYCPDTRDGAFVTQLPEGYYYIGITSENNRYLPKWNNQSSHIPSFTELYASMEDPDYVYYAAGGGYQRMIRASLANNEWSQEDAAVPEDLTLAFFQNLLEGNTVNIYCQAAGQVFYRPEAVDLYLLFYNGFPEWHRSAVPFTEEETAFLTANGWGEDKPIGNAVRFPISAMDERLRRFLGITFEESWEVGLDRMAHFFDATQCYYAWRSDSRSYAITVYSVEYTPATDLYEITYLCDDGVGTVYRMTLKQAGQIFRICANVPAD